MGWIFVVNRRKPGILDSIELEMERISEHEEEIDIADVADIPVLA
jgi:hypothetical protein